MPVTTPEAPQATPMEPFKTDGECVSIAEIMDQIAGPDDGDDKNDNYGGDAENYDDNEYDDDGVDDDDDD